MKRRKPQPEEAKLSLFPFLDVLLCTMGTLIILLIVITSQAWRTAQQAPVETTVAEPENPDDNPSAWQARVTKLESAHSDVTDAVKQRSVELGYLEQNTRKLQARIVELHAMLHERKRLEQQNSESVEKAAAEAKRLEDQIAEAQKDLAELRKESKDKPAAYSIIPYEGPNQTPRRPVYIECRATEVILQPEGIVLTGEDFITAADPGNPLVTALRATREYLAGGKELAAQQEPYPLIVVRPDGVEAYYAVRQSLQGWTSDFGYEMVEKDWKLKFPTPDPNLAIAQNQALAEARLRQKGLIAMLERRSKKGQRFAPAARGGIVREVETAAGGAGVPYREGEESEEPGFGSPGFAGNKPSGSGRDGNANGTGTGGNGTGGNGTGGNGEIGGLGTGNGTGNHAGRGNGSGLGAGNAGGGSLAANTGNGNTAGNGAAGNNANNTSSAGERGNGNDPRAAGDVATSTGNRTNANPGERNYGDAATQAGGDGNGRGASGDPNNRGGGATNSAQVNAPNPNAQAAKSVDKRVGFYDGVSRPGGTSPGGNGGEGGSPGGGDPAGSSGGGGYTGGTPDVASRDNKANPNSIAKARGKDWALRYAEPTATAVTRPLRVICYADRLVVVTGDAQRGNKEVILKTTTRESVDDLTATVWEEIKTWGIAGKGMYWQPILSFDVQSGGEARFEDFRKLFDGSGFEVRRRTAAVARLPNPGTRTR